VEQAGDGNRVPLGRTAGSAWRAASLDTDEDSRFQNGRGVFAIRTGETRDVDKAPPETKVEATRGRSVGSCRACFSTERRHLGVMPSHRRHPIKERPPPRLRRRWLVPRHPARFSTSSFTTRRDVPHLRAAIWLMVVSREADLFPRLSFQGGRHNPTGISPTVCVDLGEVKSGRCSPGWIASA